MVRQNDKCPDSRTNMNSYRFGPLLMHVLVLKRETEYKFLKSTHHLNELETELVIISRELMTTNNLD